VSANAATAAAVLALLPVLATGCDSGSDHAASSARADPPLLVPWSRVGDISLGEPRARVEREYGGVGHGFHFLAGSAGLAQGYYRLHGTRVYVTFEAGRVNELEFSTRYYRTKGGFGVGSRIPVGPCHRTATTACEHRWHGFLYNLRLREDPCSCWVKVGTGKRSLPATGENFLKPWTIISVRRGRVVAVFFALRYVD